MTLSRLKEKAQDKTTFDTLNGYADFCEEYLCFIADGLQARIVSQNEHNYLFFQYREDGGFQVTRPINANLMLSANDFHNARISFTEAIANIREIQDQPEIRATINKFVYTCQQAIGATLDALVAGKSNRARKINGDLFERLIQLIISQIGITASSGTIKVPIPGSESLFMSYQHDLVVKKTMTFACSAP